MNAATIKAALVAAHRSGDWETAKDLSQQKQRLKKKPRCPDCGSRIVAGARRCLLHAREHLRAHRIGAGALLALLLVACSTPPRPVTNHASELQAPFPLQASRTSYNEPTKTLVWEYYGGQPVTFNVWASPDLRGWALITNTHETQATVPAPEPAQFYRVSTVAR